MADIQEIRINPKVIVQDLGDELVLLNVETEQYFGLDEVGATFWEIAKETKSFSDILSQLLARYDVETADLERDITALTLAMAKKGLIEVRR